MKVFYHDNYNYRLGLLAKLHPFDGTKFERAYAKLKDLNSIDFASPEAPINQQAIDSFVNPLVQRYLKNKTFIFRALEVPKIPLLPFSFLDKKILQPMRWGVAGTLAAARCALNGESAWNMSGGYHHASQESIEGFCIYNDIGITYQELLASGEISTGDKILIIDTDAHHGNGNAIAFENNSNATLLDVYNAKVYPASPSTRERVDIPVPLHTGVIGDEYLEKYQHALNQIEGNHRLAFIVAGTDVLSVDPLGGMGLSIDDVSARERMTMERLNALGVPAVFVGGGGYSEVSADAIVEGIKSVSDVY